MTTTITQVIDKEGLDNSGNQTMLTFCLLLSTASCFHLRNIFIMHTHFYYLNSSTYSLFQLLASYFSCNYSKKLSHNLFFQEIYLSASNMLNTFRHSGSQIIPILVLFAGVKNHKPHCNKALSFMNAIFFFHQSLTQVLCPCQPLHVREDNTTPKT